MNLQQDIKSVTYMKTQPAHLIATVRKNHRPVVITQNGEARAVIQDIDSYEAIRKALSLLKIVAQGETDARRGRTLRQSEVFTRVAKRLRKRG